MITSKPITVKTIAKGKTIQNQWTTFEITTDQMKVIKIFNKMWPESIFAKRRIAKLNILEIYETYSIKIKNGIIITGTPSGKNKEKKCSLWKQIPIKLLPKKKAKEKKIVRIKWLVIVTL